ncbi:hypothetical protein [uncultured Microbacterium sp.]|uniref:hypothetical protein n=1 Tax=uncultured Microbacterium sp. TaxID=191216 RepID=UPI0028E73BF8|nr:hypothetical protein [uncultured Microbacterium sp.]
MSEPTRVEVLDELDWGTTEEDDIECARENHARYPAPYALCPECYRFSAHPWETTFGTQNGTMWAWGGVCKVHGAWTEST